MSWLFASGGQSIGASASASVLPMSIQGWFHLGLTGLISLLSKGLSRVFSSTTVQKHQFFIAQPSLWSSSQRILTGLNPVASKPSRGLCHLPFPSFPCSVTHPLPYNSPVFTTYFLHLALPFTFHDLHPRLDLIMVDEHLKQPSAGPSAWYQSPSPSKYHLHFILWQDLLGLLAQRTPMTPCHVEEKSVHGQSPLRPGPVSLCVVWTPAEAKRLLHCPLTITWIFPASILFSFHEIQYKSCLCCDLKSRFPLSTPDHPSSLSPLLSSSPFQPPVHMSAFD